MIPAGLPWLTIRWYPADDHVRVECLGCGWCATLLDGYCRAEIDGMFERLRIEHAGCNPDGRPLRLMRLAAELADSRSNDPGE
jgi:hypothetical protein